MFSDVHGKVIHVVQRLPASTTSSASTSSTTTSGATGGTQPTAGGANSDGRVFLDSFYMPTNMVNPVLVSKLL